jgi:hypothetical protein
MTYLGHTPYLSLMADDACSNDCWHIPYPVSIIIYLISNGSIDEDDVQIIAITDHCRGNWWGVTTTNHIAACIHTYRIILNDR